MRVLYSSLFRLKKDLYITHTSLACRVVEKTYGEEKIEDEEQVLDTARRATHLEADFSSWKSTEYTLHTRLYIIYKTFSIYVCQITTSVRV